MGILDKFDQDLESYMCSIKSKSDDKTVLKYMWWLILTAAYTLGDFHTLGITHKDVSPNNFMVVMSEKGPSLKLIDFGLSRLSTNRMSDKTSTKRGRYKRPRCGLNNIRFAPEITDISLNEGRPSMDSYAFGYVVRKMFEFAGFAHANQPNYLIENEKGYWLSVPKTDDATEYHTRIAQALCKRLRRSKYMNRPANGHVIYRLVQAIYTKLRELNWDLNDPRLNEGMTNGLEKLMQMIDNPNAQRIAAATFKFASDDGMSRDDDLSCEQPNVPSRHPRRLLPRLPARGAIRLAFCQMTSSTSKPSSRPWLPALPPRLNAARMSWQ